MTYYSFHYTWKTFFLARFGSDVSSKYLDQTIKLAAQIGIDLTKPAEILDRDVMHEALSRIDDTHC